MDMEEIRRRWGAYVCTMPIEIPFDLDHFLPELSALEGRPIRVEASYALAPGTGRWICTANEDIVQHDARATGRHRLQIIFHEIGHIVCGHRPSPAEVEAGFLALLPNCTPAALRHIAHRRRKPQHPDEIENEIEAEGFAALVLEEIDRRSGGAQLVEPTPGVRDYAEFFGW